MTATRVTLTAGRRRALIAAAAAVAVSLVIAIATWGYVPLPSFPSLEDGPNRSLAGRVVYVTGVDTDRQCVRIVPASGGESRELHCPDRGTWIETVRWNDDGSVRAQWWDDRGPVGVIIDPDTGEATSVRIDEASVYPDVEQVPQLERPDTRTRWPSASAVGPDGTPAAAWAEDGRVEVTLGRTDLTTVLDVRGPFGYLVQQLAWSPDGSHLLAVDSANRVIVIDSSGRAGPSLLITDARSVAWGP